MLSLTIAFCLSAPAQDKTPPLQAPSRLAVAAAQPPAQAPKRPTATGEAQPAKQAPDRPLKVEKRLHDHEDAYSKSYNKAISTSKPLVVFVAQPARDVEGCVTCRVDTFPGSDAFYPRTRLAGIGVVVSKPAASDDGPYLERLANLPGYQRDDQILQALNPIYPLPAQPRRGLFRLRSSSADPASEGKTLSVSQLAGAGRFGGSTAGGRGLIRGGSC